MLDGLRGIAAVAVLIGHRNTWLSPAILPHYYLSVDFFFILSGFVIDFAYLDKLIRHRNLTDFVVKRLIRLFPLLIAAGFLAALCEGARLQLDGDKVNSQYVVSSLAGTFAIPTFFKEYVFPYNPPLWSLFFELVANFLFMLIAPRASTRFLTFVTVASGVCLAWFILCNELTPLGVTDETFIAGFPRVGFSFCAGILINRWRREGRLAGFSLKGFEPLLLLLVMQMPVLPLDPFYQLLCVMVVFPILLAAGANDRPRFPGFAIFSGNLSYPLYVLHVPLLFTVAAILKFTGVADLHAEPGPAQAIFRLLAVILLATLAFYLYDRPVRGRLGRWWRARASGAAGAPNLS